MKISIYLNRRVFVMCPLTKIQISLRIGAVCSESSLRTFWIASDAKFMRTTKTLIRLRGCAGWSECSLGAFVRRYPGRPLTLKQPRFIIKDVVVLTLCVRWDVFSRRGFFFLTGLQMFISTVKMDYRFHNYLLNERRRQTKLRETFKMNASLVTWRQY